MPAGVDPARDEEPLCINENLALAPFYALVAVEAANARSAGK